MIHDEKDKMEECGAPLVNRIVFFSVVFPAIEPYLRDFFTSLENQTVKNFDVFIVNDGLENFEKYKTQYKTLNIVSVDYHHTPAKIREFGVNHVLKENYDAIIFGDADDFFAHNRIEKAITLLKDWDIVVNDFDLVNLHNDILRPRYISKRIENGKPIVLDFIIDKNIFGLSNTAVRTAVLKPVRFSEILIAVDWHLFSVLLLQHHTSIFTNETTTYYRQYTGNTASLTAELTKESLLRIIKVKSLHYHELVKFDTRYEALYLHISSLERNLRNDEYYFDYCLNYIKDNKISYPFWWEVITPLEHANENSANG
jgi:glycosyltransferase involved in cell wall biosynthesis